MRMILSHGVSETVGAGAGFDDRFVEREPVDDRGAEARVCERSRSIRRACMPSHRPRYGWK